MLRLTHSAFWYIVEQMLTTTPNVNICSDGFEHKGWWTTSYCASLQCVYSATAKKFTFYNEEKRSEQEQKKTIREVERTCWKGGSPKCVHIAADAVLTHGHGNHRQAQNVHCPNVNLNDTFFSCFLAANKKRKPDDDITSFHNVHTRKAWDLYSMLINSLFHLI